MTWDRLPKTARIDMRLPAPLMAPRRARAAARGIPCRRLIGEALEREVSAP